MLYNWKAQGKLAKLIKLAYQLNMKSDKAYLVSFSGHCHAVSLHISVSKERYNDHLFSEILFMRVDGFGPLDEWIVMLKEELRLV